MGGLSARVDARGRILVPKELRVRFGLHSGTPVLLFVEVDGIKVRGAIGRKEALAKLVGVIPGSAGKPELTPLDVKRIWEPRS